MSNRIALCAGINHFQNYPSATLQGCVNDAHDMSAVLQKLLGFTPGDITLLTDAQATKVNIMRQLSVMVDGAIKGKYGYLVFSLSSHGTQVPDLEGDELDRADEAFCPHDLAAKGGQWDRAHIIVDDELRDLFTKLPRNVLLEVYLDTCHSGTGLRAMDMLLDRKPRYLAPPSYDEFMKVDGKRARGLARAMSEARLEKGFVNHILWAACRDDQTSADANIAGGWHGAFTYYWCKVMMDTQNRLSRAEVLKRVRQYLSTGHYSQIPQLECPATGRQVPIPEPELAATAR